MTSYIIDVARTPRGRGKPQKGALSGIHPQELLAQVLGALEKRGSVAAASVDDVIAGCVSQVNEQGANIARNAVLAAGWPVEVSATSVNRFCASGLQAVNFGAMAVGSGAMDLVVAGGVESMSRVPMGSDGGGQDGHNHKLRERFFQVPQGISADLIGTLEGFSRREVDEIALRSQKNAARAVEEKRFSLIPVVSEGKIILERDESPRPETTLEGLGKLEPSFAALGAHHIGELSIDQIASGSYGNRQVNHLHTAGNSSGLADGAAAVVLASEKYVRERNLRPRARILSMATVGSDPILMLTGPAPASEKALRQAGMNKSDIDLWEINEAFAAVVLQTIRKLEIDIDKVNVNGGAIALGHPLGATGAILLGSALDELERSNQSTALITLCIGGGQGIATIIERLS
jgi:acetyl-CoA C-acetyltransferase